jgi:aminopeptidase N
VTRMRMRTVVFLGVLVLTLVFAGSAWAAFAPGSQGLGDPFFPLAGNGGYDVSHYGLDLSYEPGANQLTGTATITATATQDLSSFDLDLRGFTISRLLVNGQAATSARSGEQELVITPADGLRTGSTSRSRSTTRARPPSSPTRTGLSRAGCRPTTERSSSASRRARPRGTR